ncbi:aldo/keto reductase [Rhodococcus sp. NPDC003322]
MEYRNMGASGLRVSTLGFGAMTFGGTDGFYSNLGGSTGSEADRIVNKCLDAGVNFFDTANTYAEGRSEEVLGAALKTRRAEAVIATKGYNRIGRGPNDIGSSRSYIVRACEDSLRRLNTDYIDLYYMHNYDGLTPQEETVRALDDLVRSGKVRYVGVSNYSGWHLMKGLATADRLGVNRYVSQQVNYSLMNRDVEAELVPLGLEERVGMVIWGPLHNGMLTGKYHGDRTADGTSRTHGYLPDGEEGERLAAIIAVLREIAASREVTAVQVALNWLVRKPGVTSVLIGARTEEQLDQNLAAAEWHLSDDEMKRLDEVSDRPWRYPYEAYQSYAGNRNPYYMRGKQFTPVAPGPWDEGSQI